MRVGWLVGWFIFRCVRACFVWKVGRFDVIYARIDVAASIWRQFLKISRQKVVGTLGAKHVFFAII